MDSYTKKASSSLLLFICEHFHQLCQLFVRKIREKLTTLYTVLVTKQFLGPYNCLCGHHLDAYIPLL